MTDVCFSCGHGFGSNADVPVSPVPQILATNRPPSSLEIDLITTTVNEVAPRLKRLNEEVARLQAVLDALTTKRDKLHDYWESHKRHLSPLQRFPHEILSDIFLRALPEDWKLRQPAKGHPDRSHPKAILLPGWICQYWRQVALTTPQLWSKISIVMTRPEYIKQEMLEACLARSAQIPLSVHFHGCCSALQTTNVCSALLPHIQRCQEIDLEAADSRLVGELCEHIDQFSSVQNFKISMGWSKELHTIPHSTQAIVMPRLRHLELSDVSPNIDVIKRLPFKQLTDVRLSGHECVRYTDHLRKATGLFSLYMDYGWGNNVAISSMNGFHNRLQVLELDGRGSHFLQHLTLPNLKKFTGCFDEWPHTGFMSLLSQSGCELQSFSVACRPQPMLLEDLLECLQRLPTISELVLKDNCLDNSGNSLFNHLIENPRLASGLKQVTLAPFGGANYDALVPMILARFWGADGLNMDQWRSGTALGPFENKGNFESIRLHFFGRVTRVETRERLQRTVRDALMQMKAHGLDVQLVDRYGRPCESLEGVR